MVWFEPLTLMFLNIEAFNGHFDVGLRGQTLKPKEITSKGGKEYLWVLLKNSDSWEEKWYHLSSPKTLSPTPPALNPTQINIDHSLKGPLPFLPFQTTCQITESQGSLDLRLLYVLWDWCALRWWGKLSGYSDYGNPFWSVDVESDPFIISL